MRGICIRLHIIDLEYAGIFIRNMATYITVFILLYMSPIKIESNTLACFLYTSTIF